MTLSIVLAFGLFLGLIVFLGLIARSLAMLGKRVPGEDREFLDPLSTPLRVLWPLVRFLDFHFGRLYPPGIVKRVELQLQLTGRSYLLSARQFISLSLVAAAIALIMALLVARWLGSSSLMFPLAAALLGSLLPRLWLRDIRARTVKQVEKQLPVYLDFLTLSMEAGLNLNGSLTQAVSKGPGGPLKREFEHVLRDLKSGLPRADALRRMDDRLQIREVTNFVSSVVQSERMGGSIATTLRFQSEQRRTERFQRAEKQAMEAPVKLIFPLVVFIFPVTFIVLGFPIVMKFMQEGLL
ncbi:type II secretion system F family protein [Paraburkholderia unamae]|uniref:Tight adherence protein C n=1 Tax=Paraburkholderia unamae TaxID=219649 RepID=A0ABX5KTT2_9BURK|nr:type II secretion system F family protein [Paraburkholderia unamae]PVX84431.1 tight adherence protein C [Paraburkholderia unamae]CAG9248039.1 Type II/IV secretion system protein TadC, associated with Flp pilus assembly [Paraburkholderia unamae]